MTGALLLIEDDPDVSEAIVEVLEGAGYAVATARHGHAALAWLDEASAPPALILLDLMMPVMDGWAFKAALDRHPRGAGIPVVMMSAVAYGAERTRGLQAAAYLAKPISIDSLLAVVARFCGPKG